MSDEEQHQLLEGGLCFYGAITASITHEFANVLATIGELTGLLDDFLMAAEHGRPLDPARLRSTTARIARQVGRGTDHVKQLNHFAHAVDSFQGALDLGEVVGALVGLCDRFARLRKVRLDYRAPASAVPLDGSAFQVQHLVYRCLVIALENSRQGDVITVAVEPSAGGGRVSVTTDAPVRSGAPLSGLVPFLEVLVEHLGARLESAVEVDHPLALHLELPPHMGGPDCHEDWPPAELPMF